MWKILKTETLLDLPKAKISKETVFDYVGKERELIRIQSNPNNYVMIVPVKIDRAKNDTKFILVEQYRHIIGTTQLEFPAGKIEYGETAEHAAGRELQEETGYVAKNIHFIYSTFVGGSFSDEKILFYLAEVEDKPGPVNYTDRELGSKMRVAEYTSDQIHRLILNNEITNMASMSALLAVMLQNKESTKYLLQGAPT